VLAEQDCLYMKETTGVAQKILYASRIDG